LKCHTEKVIDVGIAHNVEQSSALRQNVKLYPKRGISGHGTKKPLALRRTSIQFERALKSGSISGLSGATQSHTKMVVEMTGKNAVSADAGIKDSGFGSPAST